MLRPLLAAGAITGCVVAGYAAVPPGVSSPVAKATSFSSTDVQGPSQRLTVAGARLTGEVRDVQGRPLAGAVVDAAERNGAWRALALTDSSGRFVLDGVPRGEITLTVRFGDIESVQAVDTAKTTSVVVRITSDERADYGAIGKVVGGLPPPAVAPFPTQRTAAEAVAMGRIRHVPPMDPQPPSMDAYARVDASGFRRTADHPLSTFSVDVDTASYSNSRRFLMEGRLPPPDAVRVEEWINYFTYAYPAPKSGDAFAVSTALAACPWNREHQLLRVTVHGREVPLDEHAPKNLVFLVDVSGSMMSRDKLPLVRTSLRMLADQMTDGDRLALVVYAGDTRVVLPSTRGSEKARIHAAIEALQAGGSTNGASGIQLAYEEARKGFVKGGVNRVVLATDGDFTVGTTSRGDLTRLIEKQRDSGVFLSVLGVGRGNLKDSTLEALADRGNGNYAYIDSLQEARRVLVEQVGATLVTIAKDVKLQVEFNPTHVGAYRLIGYENRALNTEDFADDAKDAGEIGAGHTVTALYEIVPRGRENGVVSATPLRYQTTTPAPGKGGDELATVSVRHKKPDGATSALQSHAVKAKVGEADADTAFASAVAEVALVLRNDSLATGASLAAAIERATAARGTDPGGWRAEFIRLAGLARSLKDLQKPSPSDQ